jgi:HAD superfamily hydrolase (TIGR01509 family)
MVRRCIILDIGGVLEITPDTGWEERWESDLGLPAGGLRSRLWSTWKGGSIGTVSEAEVVAQTSERLGLSAARTEAFMADLWHEYLGTPNTELMDHVRGLRGRCTLGILSNSFVGAREREEQRYRFSELVDEIVYSHETGLSKPDPRAFEAACDRLGVTPGNCLFVDDVPVNVEAARTMGMQAHLFTGLDGNAEAIARISEHLDAEERSWTTC